ncbi:uncharacterized protein LOC115152306 isoform X3 [Salmo trutta]|uniref:uncharacterized protein LOC115152306 isoform X3 n=1 Tax=Salmo trutta TaxID=8032 RepID=UPI0011317BE0|nr:uncharacterized protein LOC115152306 isoform X3 [Salmo trutta]
MVAKVYIMFRLNVFILFYFFADTPQKHPKMNGSILPIFLALCLAGWAVSGASFEDNLTLWSRGEMASLPQCPTTPPPSGKCLLCVESQKVYAVCDSEIIKPVFEGQGSSMPVIEANCPSTVSTDETGGPGGFAGSPDPNPPTMTPDVTGRLSKEKIIAIVLIPIAFFVILILVVLRRRTSSSVVWCPLQKSTQSNTRPS